MNKKTAVLSTAVILSLALGGVAYAHWMEIITIDGFVQTGTLELVPAIYEYDLTQNKPIARWENIGQCQDTLEFDLVNVYPCLEAWMCMYITNTGTVPAGLSEIRLDILQYSEDGTNWYDYVEGVDYETTEWIPLPIPDVIAFEKHIYTGIGNINDPDYYFARVRIELSEPVPGYPGAPDHSWIQIDDGRSVSACAYIHFYEGTPEGTQFKFQIDLEYWNWNEVV